jgi:hypothetical protein
MVAVCENRSQRRFMPFPVGEPSPAQTSQAQIVGLDHASHSKVGAKMRIRHQIIHIEPEAPAKPAFGTPCNGCGVCCLAEPCPLGMVLSGKRRGACEALVWVAAGSQYRCGALEEPQVVLHKALPGLLQGLARPLAPLLKRLAHRWIAAGVGCDCKLTPHD